MARPAEPLSTPLGAVGLLLMYLSGPERKKPSNPPQQPMPPQELARSA
jgi:hypothetical protein